MELDERITKWLNENMIQKDLQETKKIHEGEDSPLFPFLVYEIGKFYKVFNGQGKEIEEWLNDWYFNEDFFAVHDAFADIFYHCTVRKDK